ncbi:MAG: hypothetical protein GX263_08790 [Firmicutes bacterium]|jgi:stage V sporulation protein T|nr:hypothetical protein [Bacillota bacterium]
MKGIGAIRRIDNLGRIAVPKELRRNLCIGTGEPLEIFVDREKVVFKKYSPVLEMKNIALKFVHILHEILSGNVFITDRDQVVASSDPGQIGKKIDCIDNNIIKALDGEDILESRRAISPIRADGYILGAVGLQKDNLDLTAFKIIKVTASIIGKQLE